MTGTTILAIDLGKYKCVSCTYDTATAAAEFRTITTSRAEVERLVRATRPAVVVIEACTPAGWVHDLCRELGVPVKVANTAAEAWKYQHTRRKTDRDDALRLAQLEALGQLPTVVVPEKKVREWRALIAQGDVPGPAERWPDAHAGSVAEGELVVRPSRSQRPPSDSHGSQPFARTRYTSEACRPPGSPASMVVSHRCRGRNPSA